MAVDTLFTTPKEPHAVVVKKIFEDTASGASEEIMIAGAKKVTLFLKRSNHAAGSSAFDVDVSCDGTNYVDYNKLISNVTNTNAQTETRVGSVTLSSNTTSIVSLDLEKDAFLSMKLNVTETTDGTHEAWAVIEY